MAPPKKPALPVRRPAAALQEWNAAAMGEDIARTFAEPDFSDLPGAVAEGPALPHAVGRAQAAAWQRDRTQAFPENPQQDPRPKPRKGVMRLRDGTVLRHDMDTDPEVAQKPLSPPFKPKP